MPMFGRRRVLWTGLVGSVSSPTTQSGGITLLYGSVLSGTIKKQKQNFGRSFDPRT
jgi:hypothetical protein